MMRNKCPMTATAIAEYFCSQGKDVLLMMDNLTRFAMAQREIGLSTGELPLQEAIPVNIRRNAEAARKGGKLRKGQYNGNLCCAC